MQTKLTNNTVRVGSILRFIEPSKMFVDSYKLNTLVKVTKEITPNCIWEFEKLRGKASAFWVSESHIKDGYAELVIH